MEKEKLNNIGVKLDLESDKNDLLREDLHDQLRTRNKFEEYFINLAEDYIFYSNLKDGLKLDIAERGFTYDKMTGNGFLVPTPNESVRNVITITNLMLRILKDLGLQEPEIVDDFDAEDLY